jgi:hypothetical protein
MFLSLINTDMNIRWRKHLLRERVHLTIGVHRVLIVHLRWKRSASGLRQIIARGVNILLVGVPHPFQSDAVLSYLSWC